jgi:hypothetical protein
MPIDGVRDATAYASSKPKASALVPGRFDDTRRQRPAARIFRLPVRKRLSYQSGLQIARFANSASSRFRPGKKGHVLVIVALGWRQAVRP